MAALGVAAAGCGPGGTSPPTTRSGGAQTAGGGTAGGAASGGGAAGSSSTGEPGDVAAGKVSDFPVGSLTGLAADPVAVGHDSQGVYAMTLICTHAGCDASVSGQEVVCPCHGSVFDANGNVMRGPAPTPLEHYAVTEDSSGNLTVHTANVVDPATRLKP